MSLLDPPSVDQDLEHPAEDTRELVVRLQLVLGQLRVDRERPFPPAGHRKRVARLGEYEQLTLPRADPGWISGTPKLDL